MTRQERTASCIHIVNTAKQSQLELLSPDRPVKLDQFSLLPVLLKVAELSSSGSASRSTVTGKWSE